ncbi:hypothetical protein PMF13cell1_00739 [Blautia producta]|uniref:Uncharacterized protein n=1 Tax=Blautia producta TaxID=33035 RepID=A0A4P6LUA2_9FIRM|nr:hypothetical protein [Blautia producta]QBE95225.1 hypothetical protein PMF13cell1_00739 [Blautia producta]
MTKKVVEIQEKAEPAYMLRNLAAKDVFPMVKIISKIGINEFMNAFEAEEIKKLVSAISTDDEAKEEDSGEKDGMTVIGISVALNIANTLLGHLGDCEQEIYAFLCGLSGKSKEELMEMPMNTFLEMVVDVFKKEEFRGFIGVVSRLVK